MTPHAQLTALNALRESDGWRLVRDRMKDELLSATITVARNANASDAELRYRQGVAYAVSQLMNLPDALIQLAENDIRIAEAMAASPQPDTPRKPRSRQHKSLTPDAHSSDA